MDLASVATAGLAAVALSAQGSSTYSRPLRARCSPPCRVQVVVARYAEPLGWLAHLPFRDVLVYDKNDAGDGGHGGPPPHARVQRLPNVGRCDHTYLHHICSRYDDLADVTVFVPGSCPTSKSKWNKLEFVVQRVCRRGDSAFPVDEVFREPVHVALAGFEIDRYRATDGANAASNPEARLQLCPHRPFRAFYGAMFGDAPDVREVAYQGVFAVSREHVHQRPLEEYEQLRALVGSHSNPEAGHYIERSWLAIFHPVPGRCVSLADWGDPEAQAFYQAKLVVAACLLLVFLWAYRQ